jgi:hypothetical protein
MDAFFIIMVSILVLVLIYAIYVLLDFHAQKYVEIHQQYIEHGLLR